LQSFYGPKILFHSIAADETKNVYKLEPSKLNQLLGDNITSVYRKADDNLAKKIKI